MKLSQATVAALEHELWVCLFPPSSSSGYGILYAQSWASQVAQWKESACNAGDAALIPQSGRSPGGGHGNPLQYSCLENPMDREAWKATVHEITKSQTWLKQLSTDVQFSSVQLLSCVQLFGTSITNSWSLPKLMSIESVMPSNHLILCCPLLLLPPIPPSNCY